ncbi:uncharacterized protein N7498_009930 [Penicillium cinerascens]|uniref:ABM domain-containing protein n=1 Tax=Penicillium cinerascens TaxID=70096 RepID=A0A9W9M6D3_9EURO|nr:uncharacterized protein N7498_009930 [Penicillium cinerascens]KAJ5190945.1 hypothetical protein N7498_009930 [Penicillium cinerascens]
MAVTEIALLRLKTQEASSSTKTLLQRAQKAQSEWSGYPVHFARQIEHSNYFYIFGGWKTIAEHNGEWIKSETNQKLLTELKDDVDVEWMFHVETDPSTSSIPLDAPVIAVSRYFVEAAQKAEFDNAFKNDAPNLGAHIAPFTYSGGWRIDKEGDDEEFVLFSGWNKTEDHFGFAETEGFKEFAKIKSIIKGAEIKQVRLEKWG